MRCVIGRLLDTSVMLSVSAGQPRKTGSKRSTQHVIYAWRVQVSLRKLVMIYAQRVSSPPVTRVRQWSPIADFRNGSWWSGNSVRLKYDELGPLETPQRLFENESHTWQFATVVNVVLRRGQYHGHS